jgi:hypothetical protein
MAERRRCSVCGKAAGEWILEKSGGLCWKCSHPGFLATCLFAAVAAAVTVLAIVTHVSRHY